MKFEVLATKPGRWMPESFMFPVAFQVISLIGILWLAFNGFGIDSGMGSDLLRALRKTNLTTLAIWGVWWPAMIAMALAFGRTWCTICPMEMVRPSSGSVSCRCQNWSCKCGIIV